MTVLEFLARLSAIVPPPRYPLLRYHGALAPRSPWRRDVVPRPPETKPPPCDRAPSKKDADARAHDKTNSRSERTTPEATAGASDRPQAPRPTGKPDQPEALAPPHAVISTAATVAARAEG